MSGTSTAWTSAGIDDFSAGPTNFVLSFSGANARGDFLKFDVKYPDDDRVYSILAPTDDFDSIRNQTISKTFYPDHNQYTTTYNINVSGLKTDLTTDVYTINLKLGRDLMTKYQDLRIIDSRIYTNDEGANYCLVTLENSEPRFVTNVIIPFTKDKTVYLPVTAPPFVANDNRVLRTEMLSQNGADIPICIELVFSEIIKESQYEVVSLATENDHDFGSVQQQALVIYNRMGIPARTWDSTGATAGVVSRGDTIEDYPICIPEDGIDYSISSEEEGGGLFENDNTINVTITEIYPNGVAV